MIECRVQSDRRGSSCPAVSDRSCRIASITARRARTEKIFGFAQYTMLLAEDAEVNSGIVIAFEGGGIHWKGVTEDYVYSH